MLKRAGQVDYHRAKDKLTPLHAAVLGGNKDCLVKLIEAGHGLNVKDAQEQTPLLAAANGAPCGSNGKKDCLIELLKAGADARACDSFGRNSMQLLLLQGIGCPTCTYECAERLLEKQASVLQTDSFGKSAAHQLGEMKAAPKVYALLKRAIKRETLRNKLQRGDQPEAILDEEALEEQNRQAERFALELMQNEEAEKLAQANKREKAKKKKAKAKERQEKRTEGQGVGDKGEEGEGEGGKEKDKERESENTAVHDTLATPLQSTPSHALKTKRQQEMSSTTESSIYSSSSSWDNKQQGPKIDLYKSQFDGAGRGSLPPFSHPRRLGSLYLLLALLAGWCLSKCCIPAIVASARLPPPRPHASQSGVSIPDMQMHTILMLMFVH